VVFLSHFTGSGLTEILEMDVDFFEECLQAALEIHQNEMKRVIIAGYEDG
jgi:transcription initiation factor IIE alpha subunit